MSNYSVLSQEFLYAAKTNKPAESYIEALKQAHESELVKQLPDDEHKKAFWLNLYNAFIQITLKQKPNVYIKREKFYSSRFIQIANRVISLDDIEHGILRRSTFKWSFGYIKNPFTSSFERTYRVNILDNRIHFALNCGAASCPPIAFYKPEQINQQLELATGSYLESECEYIATKNIVQVPKILLWFYGDFGGRKGTLQLLQKHQIIPNDSTPRIQYKTYDWTLQTDNFS